MHHVFKLKNNRLNNHDFNIDPNSRDPHFFFFHHTSSPTHLYSVFLLAVRVSSISSPFFIQKLSSWAPWAELRLHCRVMGGLWESEGRVVLSEEAMVGSETSNTARWDDGSVARRGGSANVERGDYKRKS